MVGWMGWVVGHCGIKANLKVLWTYPLGLAKLRFVDIISHILHDEHLFDLRDSLKYYSM